MEIKEIGELQKSYPVDLTIDRKDLNFYDAEQEPFRIYGVKKESGKFCRMPDEIAKTVSEAVWRLSKNSAGGRVRFVTDSSCVAVHACIEDIPQFCHMPLSGTAGFDMYSKNEKNCAEKRAERYEGTFFPPYGMKNGFESILEFPDRQERLITINFPLYSSLTKLFIGLEPGASLKRAADYTYELPVLSYGSSITQGACASRPGNCYQHILTRMFDCNHWNLGFSGSAKAEDEMIDYLKGLSMRAFIMDYDHNAPTVEHLAATHKKLFDAVRREQPSLPVIMMARPSYFPVPLVRERLAIIRATYDQAVADGDRNVYMIDGHTLMSWVKDTGTVDGTHPTDSGFMSMASAIAPILGRILGAESRD